MRQSTLLSAAALALAVTANSAFAQVTTFFETSATRAGQSAAGWGNPTSFQYPYLGPIVETAGSGGFGFPRSPDASRLVADGIVTRSANDGGTIATIQAAVANNDADMFQVMVTNPATFSARIGGIYTSGEFVGQASGAGASLFLFDSAGNAIRGGTARQDWTAGGFPAGVNEGRNVVLTLPSGSSGGLYWLGVSRNVTNAFNAAVDGTLPTDVVVPRNSSGEKLFDESLLLANPGTVYDALTLSGGPMLSTDRLQSWQVTRFELPTGDPNYLDPVAVGYTEPGNGLTPNVGIFLTGAQYAVVPEPGTLSLVAAVGALALRRRSRA